MKRKISVHKTEMPKLREAFPNVTLKCIYDALSFKSHSLMASRIRCYAMNFLEKSILYQSTK